MTLRQLCDSAIHRLSGHYSESESRWMVRIIMEHLKGYTTVDLAVKANDEVSDFLSGKVDETVNRLLADEPIQYIFSEASFYGMRFKVTPAVLIPRPETEELVDMIVGQWGERSDLCVLDACTGSGCIAIALARNLPFSRVDAFDISGEALAIAEENGKNLKTRIGFFKADALNLPAPSRETYDIIVSNPPYIAEHERSSMEPNVLLHEPEKALFVPDSDPLLFYRSISSYALKALKPGGMIYFEINPLFSDRLASEMKTGGWDDVTISLDMQKHRRFLSAKLPER